MLGLKVGDKVRIKCNFGEYNGRVGIIKEIRRSVPARTVYLGDFDGVYILVNSIFTEKVEDAENVKAAKKVKAAEKKEDAEKMEDCEEEKLDE